MSNSSKTERISKDKNKDPSTKDLLRRHKEKRRIEDTSWTQCILRDVILYRSYRFRKKNSADGKFHYIQAFTKNQNPKEVFSSVKSEDNELFVKDGWKKSSKNFDTEGVIDYNGTKYEYEERLKTVASVSKSPDTDYRKYIELNEIGTSSLNIYNSLSQSINRKVLVGNSSLGGMFLRTKVGDMKGDTVTYTNRSKILSLGFLGTFLSGLLISLMTSFMSLTSSSIILGISMMLIFTGTISYAYRSTSYLYAADDKDWIKAIPEKSSVRKMKKDGSVKDDFNIVTADLNAHKNGDLSIVENKVSESTWTFEGNLDGTPSKKARKILEDSKLRISNGERKFAVAEKTAILDSRPDGFYESDDGNYILTTKSEYEELSS